MKHRIIDALQCPCGSTRLSLEVATARRIPFSDSCSEVRCSRVCSFKKTDISSGRVTPQDCTECYSNEIIEGVLCCAACEERWPIAGGIPRFVTKSLSGFLKKNQDTFSFEWKMFRSGERNWGMDMETRKGLFLRGMDRSPEELRGKLICDAGSGSGALSIDLAESFGMEVVGIDLAFGVEKAYERNTNPYVHFLQGSVLDLPFRDKVFDYLYCAGVLVHLPSTHAGFKAIVRVLKEGGRCFVWTYLPDTLKYHPKGVRKLQFYGWIRKNVTSRLPIKVQYALYLSFMPLFVLRQSTGKILGTNKNPRTWREKMQNLFDSFSVVHQNQHEPEEVLGWFADEGFANATVSYREEFGIGVRGDLPMGNGDVNR